MLPAAGVAGPTSLRSPAPTIFQTAWWLEEASGGEVEQVEVRWDGRLVGALPYHRTRRFGLVRLRMPPYTRTLGPLLFPPPSTPRQRLANQRRIVRALVDRLPRFDQFEQALDPLDTSAPAFLLAGFPATQAYTFRIDPGEPEAQLWAGLDKKLRNILRTSAGRAHIESSGDFDRFLRLAVAERQHGASTHDYYTLRRLFEAAAARGQATLRCAVGHSGDMASAVLVWDTQILYYWVTARVHDAPVSGANALLVWDAIKLAQARGLVFDFDGFCSTASAAFLEQFGRAAIVRPVVGRASAAYAAARWMSRYVKRGGVP